jgi:hypothetical protein
MLLVIAAPYGVFLASQRAKQTTTHAATVCTVSPTLVNSCHPWLGGEASNYGGIANNPKDQVIAHESRIGRQLNMVHTYHSPGSDSLTSSDLYFINRANTILETDWIPNPKSGMTFAAAGSPSNNAYIDKMADSIKSVAPKKIIFSIWHEPENDASTGMSPCTPSGKGHAGSPAEFAAMYRYIHDRMVADGVNNVVWAVNYMGATNWDKCINLFWPGNSYIDWVFWDPYAHSGSFDTMVGRFYNWLTANTDAAHAYTSKIWGIAEWNIYWSGMSRQDQIDLYNSAKTVIESNKYPRMKAFEVFDSLDQSIACYPGSNKTKIPPLIDTGLLGAYKNFALSQHFTDAFYGTTAPPPTGDTTAPSVAVTSPSPGVTVKGTITAAATASDDVKVTKVTFAVDGAVKVTDTASPYTANLDTTAYADGSHTITATAFDAAGNTKAQQVTVTVQNKATPPPPTVDTTPPSVTITSPADGATIKGTVNITATATDNVGVAKVVFSVDGNTIGSPSMSPPYAVTFNTAAYANGSHTIRAQAVDAAGNHRTPLITATVNNVAPPPAPTILSFTAAPRTVTVGSKTTLAWTSTNAVNCSVTPDGPQKTTLTSWTTAAYTSTGTKTYTLTCANSVGKTTTATTTVTVTAAPQPPSKPAVSADKTSVTAGSSVLISWSSTGASSCELTPGNISSSGGTGSKLVTNLQQTTTFTVTCSNSVGKTSNSVQVTVTPHPIDQPPTINTFTAQPATLTSGGTTTLSWTTSNVANNGCALAPSPLTSTAANGSWQSAPLTASAAFTLTCKSSSGLTASKSVSVTVNGVPAPPAPPAAPPSSTPVTSSTVKALGGQTVVNAQSDDKVTRGQSVTLDPSNVLDEQKVLNILRVEYYNGEKLIQTVSEPPYVLDTGILPAGKYTITERTYYEDGSSSERTQDITVEAKPVAVKKPHSSPVLPVVGSIVGVLVLVAAATFVIRLRRSRATLDPMYAYSDDLPLPTQGEVITPDYGQQAAPQDSVKQPQATYAQPEAPNAQPQGPYAPSSEQQASPEYPLAQPQGPVPPVPENPSGQPPDDPQSPA